MRKDVKILSALSATRSPLTVYRIQRLLYIGKIVQGLGIGNSGLGAELIKQFGISRKMQEVQWHLTIFAFAFRSRQIALPEKPALKGPILLQLEWGYAPLAF